MGYDEMGERRASINSEFTPVGFVAGSEMVYYLFETVLLVTGLPAGHCSITAYSGGRHAPR
jgi:hypothetical protein